jgi:hypothetical protein
VDELSYQAQRASIKERLTRVERLDEVEAEQWIARWEEHADAEGRPATTFGFWKAAWTWIAKQRGPKRDMNAEADDGQVYGG